MRKIIVIGIVVLVVLLGVGVYVYNNNSHDKMYQDKEIEVTSDNVISMMLETSAGSGEYQKTTASTWPTDGYIFNQSLSKCEQGSSLSWDNTNKNIVMKGNISDKCYIYFDAYAAPKFCPKDVTVEFDNGYLVFNICYESSSDSSTLHIVEDSYTGIFENGSNETDININKNTTAYKVKANCDSNPQIGLTLAFSASIVEGTVTSDTINFSFAITEDMENYCNQ